MFGNVPERGLCLLQIRPLILEMKPVEIGGDFSIGGGVMQI